jgi:hypothetical protein
MYNTIINPLRKALMLSTNEYLILDAIYHLSNNVKYGGWAIISKQKLADEYDLTKRTIINIINALEMKGLIIKDEKTKFLRAADVYCDAIQNKDKWIIASTSNEMFISGKIDEVKNLHSSGEKISPIVVKKFHQSGEKISPNNNSNNNNDNNTYIPYTENVPLVSKFNPPTKQQVEEYFVSNGYKKEIGANAFNYYSVANWKDSKGKPVKNWKQKMQGNWFRDEHKIKETTVNKIQLLK